MKKLISVTIVLALAIVLILTKPTPNEIATAFSGQMNYIIINRDQMPHDFAAAAAAATVIRAVEDLFSTGAHGPNRAMQWQTADLLLAMYSELTPARVGSLKCLWLLRNGFCFYSSR